MNIVELEKRIINHKITDPVVRCFMLLKTIISLLETYNESKSINMNWIVKQIGPIRKYLRSSSNNSLKYIKLLLMKSNVTIEELTLKIKDHINIRIIDSQKQIIEYTINIFNSNKNNIPNIPNITNILVYGNSPLIDKIVYYLLKTKKAKIFICDYASKSKNFNSNGINGNGKITMNKIIKSGFTCTYFGLSALPYMISDITHVLISAYDVMANSDIIGQVGTSMVSTIASTYNKPVIVCTETLSFSSDVKLDVEFTEKQNKKYKEYNINYDITPSKMISQIVTEKGIIYPNTLSVTQFNNKFNNTNYL